MDHITATTKVYYTTDYKSFKIITGNRQLNESKIKKIVADINNGSDMLRYCPILVTEKEHRLHIIDGQHRFWVSKKLKSPVWYILTDDITLYDIARLNSNTEKWKAKDFINCYTALDNENYIILQTVLDKYKIPVTTAISLLQSGKINDGGSTKVNFEKGSFIVRYETLTNEILGYCDRFTYINKFSRGFIKSIIKIQEKGVANLDELITKSNERPEEIPVYGEFKTFVTALESIYNNGKRNRVTIY